MFWSKKKQKQFFKDIAEQQAKEHRILDSKQSLAILIRSALQTRIIDILVRKTIEYRKEFDNFDEKWYLHKLKAAANEYATQLVGYMSHDRVMECYQWDVIELEEHIMQQKYIFDILEAIENSFDWRG